MIESENDVVISVSNLGKAYRMYSKPADRLKQMIFAATTPSNTVSKQFYKEFWALRGVNIKINRGETVGIIGRNGSGKSTLLQLISGIFEPTEGAVSVNGRISALLELGSGFNPEFSGVENVFLTGSILGISKSEMERRLPHILSFADIGEFVYQPVKTYSSGMHARLAFAVSINVDPEILIVDEILSVGDAAFQAKCMRAFHKIRDRGTTILMVTQDPYMVRTFCNKAVYLKRGVVVAFGDPHRVTEQYLLEIDSAKLNDSLREDDFDDASQTEAVSEESLSESPVYQIESVEMCDSSGKQLTTVRSGQTVTLRFRYKQLHSGYNKIVFVFSLYRHDGTYVCGNTTLMDGMSPFIANSGGEVEIEFPNIPLLSGSYRCRVAIDDERGMGIYCESFTDYFTVTDDLEAVGLMNLPRKWKVHSWTE